MEYCTTTLKISTFSHSLCYNVYPLADKAAQEYPVRFFLHIDDFMQDHTCRHPDYTLFRQNKPVEQVDQIRHSSRNLQIQLQPPFHSSGHNFDHCTCITVSVIRISLLIGILYIDRRNPFCIRNKFKI